ncbi:MAG TPA: hypothetical protein VN367_10125 [Chlorobaculum sp.]|nr:hypothetical protein [Chlorobaculum sp.]
MVRTPMEIGSGGRTKYAYVKMSMFFRVHNDEDYIDLFQTDDYNKGARLEFHNSEAAFVVANSRKSEGYDIYVIPEKIIKNRWYRLEVEVQNKGYVTASLDGKQICNAMDPGVFASMNRLVIGRGFDKDRVFKGDIDKLEVRTGDWPKFLVNLKIFKHLNYEIYLDKLVVRTGDLPALLLKLKQFKNLNYEIYFRLLANVIVLVMALTFWRKGQKNDVEKRVVATVKEKQRFLIPIFLVIQVLLMWSFEAYRSVVFGYALLFVLGWGVYPLIVPPDVMRLRSIYVIWPVVGMICLSILGGYMIGYSVKPSLYLASCVACVLLLLVINVTLNRKRFLLAAGMFKDDVADIVIYGTMLITPVVLVLIYPVLATGYSTSVYRVGPDLMQYTKMVEYLMNGGSLALSKMRAPEFAGMTPGDMNRYTDATMSWPLMNYFRWGLTFYQVMMGKIIGVNHSYQIAFVSMVVPYLLEAGMVYVWLRKINGSLVYVAYFGFVLIAFNVNMLNLWYEGFLGNAYANVLFLLIIMLLAMLMEKENAGFKERSPFVILVGFVMAALFLSYGEVLLLVFPFFLFMVIVAEFLVYRNIRWNNYLILVAGGLLGLAIVWPCNYLYEWAVLTLKQLLQEGGNGYPQPLWAMPHDILGYGDIYSYLTIDKAGKPMERTALDTLLGLPLVVGVMTFTILDVIRDQRRSRVLKIAVMMIILTVGLLVFKKSPHNNYTYMKMYVLFAPLLIIAFVSGVERWSSKSAEWEGTRMIRLLLLALPVVLNGLLYVVQYVSQETVIEKKQMVLARHMRGLNFENVLMVPYNLGVKRLIYTAIMPGMWAVPEYWNQKKWGANPYYRIHAGKKLYLLAEKEKNVRYNVKGDVVFDDGSYLIVDSKKRVEDVLCNGKSECNFDVAMYAIEEQRQEK